MQHRGREDAIVAGLNGRDADGPTRQAPARTTGQALPAGKDAQLPGQAEPPGLAADARRIAIGWARGRLLGSSSVAGIALALVLCASAWFTAGTPTGNLRAAIALVGGYLAITAARWLAGWPDAGPPGTAGAQASTARTRWRLRLAWSAAECAAYAGLAAGAEAGQGQLTWALGAAVVGLVAVRDLMTAAGKPAWPGANDLDTTPVRRAAAWVTGMAPGGRVLVIAILAPLLSSRAALASLLGWAMVAVLCGMFGGAGERPGPDDDLPSPPEILRLRDDGIIARWLGGLVRGYLLPLPPALFALAATVGLAYLGLGRLPVILTVAPPLIMLLAAPGSSNPHAGRFDWLVPLVLLGWQVLYLAALGDAAAVPGPVIFALCAMLSLRFADLASPGRLVLLAQPLLPGEPPRERGSAMGWEGRTLIAGLGVAVGLGTVAYLGLAAYLAFGICAKIAASYPRLQERYRG